MMDGHADTPRPVLPVWATVREAYAIWFANMGFWLKLSIIPLLVVIGMGVLLWLVTPDTTTNLTQALIFPPLFILLLGVCMYLSEIPLATAWHRFILTRYDRESHRYIVGGREKRYLLKAAIIGITIFLVSSILGFIVGFFLMPFVMSGRYGLSVVEYSLVLSLVSMVFSFGSYVLIGYFFGCLFLMFPAAAIGRNYSVTESWNAIKGNEWRFVGVYALVLLPIFILISLVEPVLVSLINERVLENRSFIGSGATSAGAAGGELLGYFVTLLFAPVIVGTLSIIYRELVQKREAAEVEECGGASS